MESQNPYQTPSSTLNTENADSSVTEFKRFSAWGVFGLSLITFSLYNIYWLYSRSELANTLHEKKISTLLLQSLVVLTIFSFISSFLPNNDLILILSGIASLVYVVVYLVVLYSLRNRIQDIINKDGSVYKLGGILTFFFSVIYLQYKLNQRIDEINRS